METRISLEDAQPASFEPKSSLLKPRLCLAQLCLEPSFLLFSITHSMTMRKRSPLLKFSCVPAHTENSNFWEDCVPKQKVGTSWHVYCCLQTILLSFHTTQSGPSVTNGPFFVACEAFSLINSISNKKSVVVHQLTCTDTPHADTVLLYIVVNKTRLKTVGNLCYLGSFMSIDCSLEKKIQ